MPWTKLSLLALKSSIRLRRNSGCRRRLSRYLRRAYDVTEGRADHPPALRIKYLIPPHWGGGLRSRLLVLHLLLLQQLVLVGGLIGNCLAGAPCIPGGAVHPERCSNNPAVLLVNSRHLLGRGSGGGSSRGRILCANADNLARGQRRLAAVRAARFAASLISSICVVTFPEGDV